MTSEDRHGERTRVIANAARLLADAKLLVDHSRYASAFALAVLGVEEIGKVILDIWNTVEPLAKPKIRRKAHHRKQAAVWSVLLAAFAVREFGDQVPDGDVADDLVEKVGKAFQQSPEGQFLRYVEIGALEATKHVGLYRDPSHAELDPSQFSHEDVQSIFEAAKSVMDVITDTQVMRTGRAIYATSA